MRFFTEPSTNKDVFKVTVKISRAKDLSARAWLKFVNHVAIVGNASFESIGLEISVVGKGRQTKLSSPPKCPYSSCRLSWLQRYLS